MINEKLLEPETILPIVCLAVDNLNYALQIIYGLANIG